MKYIDLIVQSVIILFSVSVLFIALNNDTSLTALLIPQLVLGAWQMISSIVSVIFRMRTWHVKKWHLIFSTVYLISLLMISHVSLAVLMVPSWVLAGFYYVVTCVKTLTRQRKNGSFLPHLSF